MHKHTFTPEKIRVWVSGRVSNPKPETQTLETQIYRVSKIIFSRISLIICIFFYIFSILSQFYLILGLILYIFSIKSSVYLNVLVFSYILTFYNYFKRMIL